MTKKKKKKRLKIIIFFIIIFISGAIIYNMINSHNNVKIYLELGKKLPLYIDSYIDNKTTNCKISWKNVNVEKIGNYKGNAKCKTKKYSIELNIGDTTSPEITQVENLEVSLGDKLDLISNILVKDNSKDNIIPKVLGSYDFDKEGVYDLKYQACDKSNNCSEENFTLKVENALVVKPKYIDGVLIVNKSYPLPQEYVPENLVKLSNGALVIDYVKDAFDSLIEGSIKENLNIYPSTAYRSIAFQTTLYNNYVARDGKQNADTYSARPGYSEHHTGLAIDVNNVNSDFNDTDEAKWLEENCYKYGFILRYPKGSQEKTGYKYESWHIRYVGETLAKKLYNNGSWITLEEYFNIDSKYKD